MKHFEKTNSVDDDVKIVFSDLSDEELMTSFCTYTSPEQHTQLVNELKFGMLFETADWLRENFKEGCVKCAPFLQRQTLRPFPTRPIELITPA